jgi:hypothetical protein
MGTTTRRQRLTQGIGWLVLLALPACIADTGSDANFDPQDRTETAALLDRLFVESGSDGAVELIESRLQTDPSDVDAVGLAQLVIAGGYPVSPDESMRLRELVREKARASSCVIVPPEEPGRPMVLEGVLKDPNGRPVPGARVGVYQTDANGVYTPRDVRTGRLDEPNARLFAYLRTDDQGRFDFTTIRPAGYPFAREDVPEDHPLRFIPEHIHLDIEADGYASKSLQVVFDDDPRMNTDWRKWAEDGGHPVIGLDENDGTLHGTVVVVLRAD